VYIAPQKKVFRELIQSVSLFCVMFSMILVLLLLLSAHIARLLFAPAHPFTFLAMCFVLLSEKQSEKRK